MTVQLPETDGRRGNSKGGAGNVNAVCADAGSGKAAMAPNAASNGAEKAPRTVLTAEERRKAWTTWFMEAPDPPWPFQEGRLVLFRLTRSPANIAPRLFPAKQTS